MGLTWESVKRVIDHESAEDLGSFENQILHVSQMPAEKGKIMLAYALISLVFNFVCIYILNINTCSDSSQGHPNSEHDHSHQGHCEHGSSSHQQHTVHSDINVYATYMHLVGDLLNITSILIGGILIAIDPSYDFIDPVCSIVFSLIVLYQSSGNLKNIFRILMECAPDEIDV